MTTHVSDKEVKAATTMAERKAGVTRKQLASKLSISPDRAKIVLEKHAMQKGKWTAAKKGGSGKDNRTMIYRRGKGKNPAKPAVRARKKAKKVKK